MKPKHDRQISALEPFRWPPRNPMVILGLILLVALATRLPQLLSPYFILDGDECVVGLMAKHIAEGKGFPLFNYGQNYSLSGIEAGVAAIGFRLFGVSPAILKLTQLLIWSVGVYFSYLAVKEWFDEWTGSLAALIMLFLPAWAVMSMRLWSGYVNGFLLLNICLYLLALLYKDKAKRPHLSWCLVGIVLALAFYTQPLFVICMLPFVVFVAVSRQPLASCTCSTLGFISVKALLHLIFLSKDAAYWPAPKAREFHSIRVFLQLPRRLFHMLSGSYDLVNYQHGFFISASGILWTIIFFAIAAMIIRHPHETWRHKASSMYFASLVCVILASQLPKLSSAYGDRYLIPASVLIVPLFAYRIKIATESDRRRRLLAYWSIASLICFCAITLLEFSKNTVSISLNRISEKGETGRTLNLIHELQNQGVHHVYCLDPMFQWNITFYSQEKVLARWMDPVDRYPEYPRLVDEALSSGKPVALVDVYSQVRGGFSLDSHRLPKNGYTIIDGTYLVLYQPTRELLRQLGFSFERNPTPSPRR